MTAAPTPEYSAYKTSTCLWCTWVCTMYSVSRQAQVFAWKVCFVFRAIFAGSKMLWEMLNDFQIWSCHAVHASEHTRSLSWFHTTSACFAFILTVNSSSAENLHERWISRTLSAGSFMLLPELCFTPPAPADQRRRSLPTILDRLSFDYPNYCSLKAQSAHSEKVIWPNISHEGLTVYIFTRALNLILLASMTPTYLILLT